MTSDIKKVTLENGLRIVMMPMNFIRTVTMGVWAGSGTRYETPDVNGVSHFIEHMLFKGTHSRSAFDIAEKVDEIGANLNAYTSKQYTCFYAKSVENKWETVADILFDMVTDPRFNEQDLETEKGVICEEIEMYRDSPDDIMIEGMYAGVWKGNMLGSEILGTQETVGAMTPDTLRRYMKQRYIPSRMVISVAGNFDPDRFVKKVESFFGSMPRVTGDMGCARAEYNSSINLFKRDFEQTNVCIGFKADGSGGPYRHAIAMFNSILGGSSSSRLYQEIREKRGLAYSVGSSYAGYMHEGLFAVDMGVNAECEEDALRAAKDVLDEIKANGITKREFERVRQQLAASVIMGLEGAASMVSHMGREELLENRIRTEEQILEGIEKVTIDDINNIAKRYIDFSTCSVSAVGRSIHDEQFYIDILRK
ncbi:MAG: insulinase family protein [Clostridia bacterium]|nr:insulinase family protein [Clostridia bacterium]